MFASFFKLPRAFITRQYLLITRKNKAVVCQLLLLRPPLLLKYWLNRKHSPRRHSHSTMLSLARKRSKRTVADERITYKVFDFSWSFSPLFNWLRLFGIALNESTEQVNVQKNLSQGFYILVPICTLAARIYTILDTTCQLISFSTLKTKGVATEITTTLLWSQSLRLLTQHLALITSQIAIFIVSFSRWGLLVSCFRRLERSMKIGRTCYIQLRRACTIGLLWLLLVPHCIFFSYIFKFSAVYSKSS